MKRHAQAVIGGLAILAIGGLVAPAGATLISATDVSRDSRTFEVYFTAVHQDLDINGTMVHAMVFKDDPPPPKVSAGATIPGPLIKVKVGDTIICHFKNSLTNESASIHWHGLELDNDSDGTAVTQDAILPGQSYKYVFKTARPGVFWYHSHMLPGNTTFAGMYGVIIVENPIEAKLKAKGKLPSDAYTYTLALSDIEFDASGKVGKPFGPGITPINELVELCHLDATGEPGGDRGACGGPTPGETVLVNGINPNAATPTPKFTVPSGKKIRLRLANEAISRHFRLSLLNSGDTNLYRIGGQGGLLDNVRLEGGTQGTWDTKYNVGEIALGSGDRVDVLAVISGNQGDIIQLVGNPLPNPFNLSAGLPANYPIAFFEINGTSTDTPPQAGDPILAGTAEQIENIKTNTALNTLTAGNPTIRFTNTKPAGFANAVPGIDDYGFPTGQSLDSNTGNGDFLNMPSPPTARFAHVGDLLEFTVKNETAAVHPFHLHGFSFQPVSMVDNATGTTLYNFDYDEFRDTVDVYGNQTFVFRVRLDDRARLCDSAPGCPPAPGPILAACGDGVCGGAVGRWLFHCHIFHHAGLGMMSELVVLDNRPPVISTCSLDNSVLWPADHKMRTVTLNYTATDCCGGPVTCALSVTSNEPESGTGSGDLSPDWQIIDDHHVKLRAERSDTGTGRVYSITITATDASGNTATAVVKVSVPLKAPKGGRH